MSSKIKCLNNWDVESKHVFDVNGISDALYAGECRYGGGEKYVLYESKDAIGFDAYNLDSTEDKAKTITAGRNDTHNIPVTCYGISAYNSNAMMSSNPHSGIYEATTSRTLDLNGGNPACNQGGMMVVIALEGNDSRPSHAGNGWAESKTMYTLNTIEQHAVCFQRCGTGDQHPMCTHMLQRNSQDKWKRSMKPMMVIESTMPHAKFYAPDKCPTICEAAGTGGGHIPIMLFKVEAINHDIRSTQFASGVK